MADRQLTTAAHGHVLTHTAVWSPDGRWIVYDVRSAPDGSVFDGTRIERVDVVTGAVETLYQSRHGACCGVVTASPIDDRVLFILGPERPDATWSYGPTRRQGVILTPGDEAAQPLDARDLVPPFTPGALRGGSHVHVFSGDARLVSFTYDDEVLRGGDPAAGCQATSRCVGVAVTGRPVRVPPRHPRNHDGTAWSTLVTVLDDAPTAGGAAISRAFEDAWIGRAGYPRSDGTRQRYALAFQGLVRSPTGGDVAEAFVVDLPDDPTGFEQPGAGPLEGTATTRPEPPAGVVQRRITTTTAARHPGIQGPRHWLRSSPDGAHIGCLMRDDDGVVQLVTVSPTGGPPEQRSRDGWSITSAFSWSPAGDRVAYVADGSVMALDVAAGVTRRLTHPDHGATGPRPEACVFSPDGRRIAYLRTLPGPRGACNQVCVVDAD